MRIESDRRFLYNSWKLYDVGYPTSLNTAMQACVSDRQYGNFPDTFLLARLTVCFDFAIHQRIRSKRATTTSCSIAISTRQRAMPSHGISEERNNLKSETKTFFFPLFDFVFISDDAVDACAILSQLSRSSCCVAVC